MIFKYLLMALLFGGVLQPATAFFSSNRFGNAFGTTIPVGFHPHLFGAEMLHDYHQDPAPQHHGSLRYNNEFMPPAREHRVAENPSHFDIMLRAAHPADATHFSAELAHDDTSLAVHESGSPYSQWFKRFSLPTTIDAHAIHWLAAQRTRDGSLLLTLRLPKKRYHEQSQHYYRNNDDRQWHHHRHQHRHYDQEQQQRPRQQQQLPKQLHAHSAVPSPSPSPAATPAHSVLHELPSDRNANRDEQRHIDGKALQQAQERRQPTHDRGHAVHGSQRHSSLQPQQPTFAATQQSANRNGQDTQRAVQTANLSGGAIPIQRSPEAARAYREALVAQYRKRRQSTGLRNARVDAHKAARTDRAGNMRRRRQVQQQSRAHVTDIGADTSRLRGRSAVTNDIVIADDSDLEIRDDHDGTVHSSDAEYGSAESGFWDNRGKYNFY